MEKENKMAVMPMPKLVVTMSIPLMLSLLIQMLMIAVGVGTGVGANAVLAKNIGAGNTKKRHILQHGIADRWSCDKPDLRSVF